MSRLESGQRRPSLELLFPIALAHQIPLDELVAVPQVGDPRVQLAPRQAHGRTVVPLTRHPGGLQAYKIIIPDGQHEPDPRTHEGYEWLYVLSGRLRLWLAEHDLGFLPMPDGGRREAALAADYNAEMIEHVERHRWVRDRAIFVGDPEDVVPTWMRYLM